MQSCMACWEQAVFKAKLFLVTGMRFLIERCFLDSAIKAMLSVAIFIAT